MASLSVSQRINGFLRRVPAWPIYIIGPIPGIWVFWLALNNRLGADPLQYLEHSLGERGLQLIILTLLITPLRRLTGVSLLKFRRAVGVVAFVYVLGHLLTWVVLDQQLFLSAIVEEIIKRPFITIGMVGFVAMVPLAVTSNNLSLRRLGPARWRRIHKLAYIAAIAGAAHYLLLVKAWPMEPIVYALIVVALLAIRGWWSVSPRRSR